MKKRTKQMTQQQTDAMADILRKLNNGVDKSNKGGAKLDPTSSTAQADAMAEVLRKLQNVTGERFTTMVTENVDEPEFSAAINTTRTETGVSVSRYDIRTEKKTVQEGLKKTFYHIVDNQTGAMLYEDLGLFETAMGIVKHTLYTKNDNKIDRLVELDQEYVGAIMEAYGYKKRLKRLDESSLQYDIATAKYTNIRTKVTTTKMKILKAL